MKEELYAVTARDGSKILQIFEDKDDAERFVGLLDALEHPPMKVYEIEEDQALRHVKISVIITRS